MVVLEYLRLYSIMIVFYYHLERENSKVLKFYVNNSSLNVNAYLQEASQLRASESNKCRLQLLKEIQ